MKFFRALLFAVLISTSSFAFAQGVTHNSSTFAQGPTYKPITVYDPDNAIHPFLLTGLVLRPPVALLQVLVKGFYSAINAEPIERVFNIEYQPRTIIDEDY